MLKYTIHHAKTCTQDRHNRHFLTFNLIHLHRTIPAFDRDFFGFKVRSRFISQ
ncbi:Uncharacterised protein [Vibrio cholerae]|nr:Uncharacterised protein [Vibrio cholerae]CSC12013.1 Uncharacterised protein [Vibrio cholerae]CSC49013.1 Uncharacterised protein [Vibrio cholerae]